MALFKEGDLRRRAQLGRSVNESAESLLIKRSALASTRVQEFDIFLSHSVLDKELILGILLSLEDMGYSVYVDWVNDKQLNRASVTKATAEVLRRRMQASKSLFFATSVNSSTSKWMPWELGFMDGHNKKAAIFPITRSDSLEYVGQEYLGIYPFIDIAANQGDGKDWLWVNQSKDTYTSFELWLKGGEFKEHN